MVTSVLSRENMKAWFKINKKTDTQNLINNFGEIGQEIFVQGLLLYTQWSSNYIPVFMKTFCIWCFGSIALLKNRVSDRQSQQSYVRGAK